MKLRRDAKTRPAKLPLLAMPADIPDGLRPIADEVHRIHESVLWSAQVQFEQMKFWRAMNSVFGVPAAVLAAVAGGTGLAADEATSVPGVLALLAAGFGAALTALNPSRRVSQAQAAANAYLELQTAARQLLLIDLPPMPAVDAREHLTNLSARRDEVNRTADPPGYYAYWRASRNIKKGRQSHDADKSEK